MSFFTTTAGPGNRADLGGLEGALAPRESAPFLESERQCARLASTLRQELDAGMRKAYARGCQLAATALERDRDWLPRKCPYAPAEILE